MSSSRPRQRHFRSIAIIATFALALVAMVAQAAPDQRSKRSYDYKCVETSTNAAKIEKQAQELGRQGWKLKQAIMRPAGMKVKTILCFER